MVVVVLFWVEDALGQPCEFRQQSMGAHQVGKLDVIETVVIRHIR